jgi:hypothetical protein
MFILPYIYHKIQLGSLTVYQWNILTISGNKLWEEVDTMRIKEDILDPNGFILCSSPKHHGSIVFCELDKTKLTMDEYYSWEEMTSEELEQETFCWRKFYIFGPITDTNPSTYTKWFPTPDSVVLEPYSCQHLFQQLLQQHMTTI